MSRAVRALMSLVKKKKKKSYPKKKKSAYCWDNNACCYFHLVWQRAAVLSYLLRSQKVTLGTYRTKAHTMERTQFFQKRKKLSIFKAIQKTKHKKKAIELSKALRKQPWKKKTRRSLSVLVISFAFFFSPLTVSRKKTVKSALWFFFFKKKKNRKRLKEKKHF